MSDVTIPESNNAASYVARVFQNESLKKGAAAAVAGLLVAAVQEAILAVSVATLLADALLDQVRESYHRDSRRVREFLAWLREAARPVPGFQVESSDGSVFTGIIVVDRNRPVVMLGAQQAAWSPPTGSGRSPYPSPPPSGPPPGSPGHRPPGGVQHPLFTPEEDDASLWRRPDGYWPR